METSQVKPAERSGLKTDSNWKAGGRAGNRCPLGDASKKSDSRADTVLITWQDEDKDCHCLSSCRKHSKCRSRSTSSKEKKFLVCLLCGTTFQSNIKFSSHMCSCAKRGRLLRNIHCKTFRSKRANSLHAQRHGNETRKQNALQTCTICQNVFRSSENFKRHVELHTKLHEVLLRMPVPKITTLFRDMFTKYHKRLMLEKSANGREFRTAEAFRRWYRRRYVGSKHMTSNCEVRGFIPFLRCKSCPRRCRTILAFRIHTATHRSARCSICGKSFSTSTSMKLHSRKHKLAGTSKNTLHKQSSVSKVYKHTDENTGNICSICSKGFSSRSCLNRHQRVHTGEKPYKCQECGEEFRERIILNKHMTKHTGIPLPKKHQCSVCGKSFALSSVLQHHMRGHGDKNLECSHCSKRFSHQKLLDRHVTTHTGERQFVCEICGKKFLTKNNMQRHAKTHTDEKPFKCSWCNKLFRQSGNLKTHERIHTKEKPYRCEECGRRFTQSANLKHHMLLHSGTKKFLRSETLQQSGIGSQERTGSPNFFIPSVIPKVTPSKVSSGKTTGDAEKEGSCLTRYAQNCIICCQYCQRSFPNPRDFPWHKCKPPSQKNLHRDLVQKPTKVSFDKGECLTQSTTRPTSSLTTASSRVFEDLRNARPESNVRMVAELAYKPPEYPLLAPQFHIPDQMTQSIPQGAIAYAQHTGTFIPTAISTFTGPTQQAFLFHAQAVPSQNTHAVGNQALEERPDQFYQGVPVLGCKGGLGFFHPS